MTWGIGDPKIQWRSKVIRKKRDVFFFFIFKQFYLNPSVGDIWYATFQHVIKDGRIVHICVKSGLRSVFFMHVLEETRAFVLEHLRLGLSIYQVMNKHKCRVKEMMENYNELPRNLFLNGQDIINLARKLAKKTYKKHENDAHSVWMWVVENKKRSSFTKTMVGRWR